MTVTPEQIRAPRYWKVLDASGRSCHGGSFQYSLPTWDEDKGWVPGAWTPPIRNPELCVRGYHVCRDGDLLHWLNDRIYACEVRGTIIAADDKVVVESLRLTCPTPWDDCAARLFGVECAADVLPIYERRHPTCPQVADALEVAFRYAVGDATDADLSAAESAAWSAAEPAAEPAARAAAWSAAWSAAESAAESAARSAVWSAAWSAARSAAWSAARAAAWSAAWSAAESAARSAVRAKQTRNLLRWIGAER